VPFEIIDLSTAEHPDVNGITLPGMPQNAPAWRAKRNPENLRLLRGRRFPMHSNGKFQMTDMMNGRA
jgi:hypothetical protein